jgi:hypothetical protein
MKMNTFRIVPPDTAYNPYIRIRVCPPEMTERVGSVNAHHVSALAPWGSMNTSKMRRKTYAAAVQLAGVLHDEGWRPRPDVSLVMYSR